MNEYTYILNYFLIKSDKKMAFSKKNFCLMKKRKLLHPTHFLKTHIFDVAILLKIFTFFAIIIKSSYFN